MAPAGGRRKKGGGVSPLLLVGVPLALAAAAVVAVSNVLRRPRGRGEGAAEEKGAEEKVAEEKVVAEAEVVEKVVAEDEVVEEKAEEEGHEEPAEFHAASDELFVAAAAEDEAGIDVNESLEDACSEFGTAPTTPMKESNRPERFGAFPPLSDEALASALTPSEAANRGAGEVVGSAEKKGKVWAPGSIWAVLGVSRMRVVSGGGEDSALTGDGGKDEEPEGDEGDEDDDDEEEDASEELSAILSRVKAKNDEL